MTDPVQKCDWRSTPFATPYSIGGRSGRGFADEWTINCVNTGTLRIEPRAAWEKCLYCGRPINFLTDPDDPSLPHTV